MVGRLTDERIDLMRDNCEDVISGRSSPHYSVREILSLLVEIQDHRDRVHASGVLASHIRAIRSELSEMARVLDVKESP